MDFGTRNSRYFKSPYLHKEIQKVLALSRSQGVRGERGIEQEDEHLNDFFTAPHRTTWGSFFVARIWVHFVDSSDSVRGICAGFLIDINSSQDAGSLRVMKFWKIHLKERTAKKKLWDLMLKLSVVTNGFNWTFRFSKVKSVTIHYQN